MSLKTLRSHVTLLIVIATVAILPSQLQAQNGFVSAVSASSSGLTIAWGSQLEISAREPLVDWQLVVDENRATTYFNIAYGKRKETISEADISPFGVPYGIEGAKEAAELRKEIIEAGLRNDGKEDVEVTISSYSLPKSSIYALGGSGQLICLNADTGAVRWKQQVGNSKQPSVGLGASNDHVAVADGTSIICLDSADGRILWTGRCSDGINTSPAVSENYIHVPLISGRLQTFPIDKFGVTSFSRVAYGHPSQRPLITEKHVVWTTESGHMNVAPLDRQTVAYRLKSHGGIVAQAASSKGYLYTGSLDGFVYGVKEDSGILDWEVATGQGITSAPATIGQDVFVVSGENKLFRLDAIEGTYPKAWQNPVPGIRQIAGFDSELVYCLTSSGQLVGINRETRSVSKNVVGTSIEMVLHNEITDRMYFGSKTGYIQCVHSADSPLPRLLSSDLPSGIAPGKTGVTPRKDKSAMGEENPFGGGGDGGETNPFGDAGSSSNPFGPGAEEKKSDEEANPFGGSSNPFGDEGGDDTEVEANPFGN